MTPGGSRSIEVGDPAAGNVPGSWDDAVGGPTAAVIFGSSGDGVAIPRTLLAFSMTSGSSIPPAKNGPGWAAATLCRTHRTPANLVYPLWESPLPGMSLVAVKWPSVGQTSMAISGSLVGAVVIPLELRAHSTIYGSSIFPRTKRRAVADMSCINPIAPLFGTLLRGGFSTAQRTMVPSVASVKMTFGGVR